MEQHYTKNLLGKVKISFLILTGILFFFNWSANAQIRENFTQRTSQFSPEKKIYSINGDFTMIGNTNLTLQNYSTSRENGFNTMVAVDKDNDSRTLNSSKSKLTFSSENNTDPSCSKVVYAGLYWTGRTNLYSTGRKRQVRLRRPGGDYQIISANSSDIRYPGDNDMYAAYAEVTDIVREGGLGDYWVADIALSTGDGGSTGYYGGWGMVVIYENAQMKPRDITVFDGYAYVEGNATKNFQLPVSGFNTAQSGDINMKLGVMAGEGDRAIDGDYFEIKKVSDNAWLRLSHENNSSSNFFNSSIQLENNGNRNPNLVNNTGLDISIFDIPNPNNSVIENNQTSTTFRYGSTRDTYIIFNLVMSVDAYIPIIEGTSSIESIDGNSASRPFSAMPGDDISYKIELRNKGTEPIDDAKLVIPVPFNVDFVQGSIEKNTFFSPAPNPNNAYFDPTLGATGSIVWELGTLPVGANTNTVLADLTIDFKVTEDCSILKNSSCGDGTNINFNGSLNGRGAISGTRFENTGLIQGFETNGSCRGQAITAPLSVKIDAADYIAQNCGNTPDEREFVYCNRNSKISISEISSGFPAGSRFYDSYPVTIDSEEFTINNPFPNTSGEYFAILPGTQNCFIPFSIVTTNINSVPQQAEDEVYCLNEQAQPLSATASNPDLTLFYYTSENDTPQLSITPATNVAGEFTYFVAEGKSASCISPNKIEIEVKVLEIPKPEINVTEQPNCDSTTGTIKVNNPKAGLTYTINGPGNYTAFNNTGIFESLNPGNYTVTAENENGCESDNSNTVNIQEFKDNEKPVFETVNNITQNTDQNACSAVVSFEIPTATDNCDGTTVTQTSEFGAGDTFPVGTTTVTYTATDASGNTDTVSFDVIVTDNEDPTINCPANITSNVTFGETGAVVTYNEVTFNDNCSATIEQTAGLASGETFPVGTTTNTFVITDASGNTATCSFDITIKEDGDAIAPTITCPANIEQYVDPGVCGAVVEFTLPSFSDNSGDVTIARTDNGPASGEVFPVGITTVSYTATDAAGNTASCSFDVTVTDNEDPVFAAVSNKERTVDPGQCEAVVSFKIPTATDNCDGTTVTQTSELGAGDTFPVGTTTVTYTATDASGNTDTVSFDVIVTDNEGPTINCPANITTTNVIGQNYALVTYTEITATDNCEVTVERTSGFASGEQFPVGITTVTYVATDINGNSVECSFTVTVKGSPVAVDDAASTEEDTPVIIAVLDNDSDPDNDPLSVAETTTPANGTVVINEDGTITYTPNPDFNGTDSFEYTITDGNGGFDTAIVTVTIGGTNDAPVAVDDAASTEEWYLHLL